MNNSNYYSSNENIVAVIYELHYFYFLSCLSVEDVLQHKSRKLLYCWQNGENYYEGICSDFSIIIYFVSFI